MENLCSCGTSPQSFWIPGSSEPASTALPARPGAAAVARGRWPEVLPSAMMKRQRMIAPGVLSRMLHNAGACWNRQEYDQYFEIMERASRLDPANHGLLLDLGSAHGKRYNYAAAERCFEKA